MKSSEFAAITRMRKHVICDKLELVFDYAVGSRDNILLELLNSLFDVHQPFSSEEQ